MASMFQKNIKVSKRSIKSHSEFVVLSKHKTHLSVAAVVGFFGVFRALPRFGVSLVFLRDELDLTG